MPSRERRRHFRGRGAAALRIPVRHRVANGAWQDGETLNIGSGGAFVIGATWPVGSAVELALEVAGREAPMILSGVVRWAADDGVAHDTAGLPGVGVQFLDLDLDLIIELNRHLAALAAEGEDAADDDPPAAG